MNLVCSAHHEPVSAKGKGCQTCAREIKAYRKRRAERRNYARAKEAAKRA